MRTTAHLFFTQFLSKFRTSTVIISDGMLKQMLRQWQTIFGYLKLYLEKAKAGKILYIYLIIKKLKKKKIVNVYS